jgi:hypothetical protein
MHSVRPFFCAFGSVTQTKADRRLPSGLGSRPIKLLA